MRSCELAFDGDPYRLIEPLEELFGSLFFYRYGDAVGRRTFLFASLEDAVTLPPAAAAGAAQRLSASVEQAIERLQRRAAAKRERSLIDDVVFALSYDLGLLLARERMGERSERPPLDAGPPLGFVARVARAVSYDERTRRLRLESPSVRDEVRFRAIVAELQRGAPSRVEPALAADALPRLTDVVAPLDRARFGAQHAQLAASFECGDVYQVVLSSRVRVRPKLPTVAYFAELAKRYRSAHFSYYVRHGGLRFFGNCSLPHVTKRRGLVSTRVFAGTNPAPRSAAERRRIHRHLRTDLKYQAEHIMLVDLERNDLGMYCTPGSVRVRGLLTPIEIGPTTYLATDVQGRVEPDASLAQLLLTGFPRGVVCGAPKSTALRLIGAIEGEPRGFYAGAMGWYRGVDDELVSNTIVTCAHEHERELVLQCGGGITHESTATQEFYELELKLRYLI